MVAVAPRMTLALFLVMAATLSAGAATPTPSPGPAPTSNPAINALVVRYWNQLATGTLDKNLLTPEFAAGMTPQIREKIRSGIAAMGKLRYMIFTLRGTMNGVDYYGYTLVFASGLKDEFIIWVTADGKIAGSRLLRYGPAPRPGVPERPRNREAS
jgi:hypothetical protein